MYVSSFKCYPYWNYAFKRISNLQNIVYSVAEQNILLYYNKNKSILLS